MEIFERHVPGKFYGNVYPGGTSELSYRTSMIDQAIRADDWARVEEAIRLGWLTQDCRAFDNSHVIDYCLFRGARKCALELRALGWTEWHRA